VNSDSGCANTTVGGYRQVNHDLLADYGLALNRRSVVALFPMIDSEPGIRHGHADSLPVEGERESVMEPGPQELLRLSIPRDEALALYDFLVYPHQYCRHLLRVPPLSSAIITRLYLALRDSRIRGHL
jgi:hypothetical protein